ncbi:MAG: tetratricopeptide repeat protein [Acidobacteriaceae bacterium]
MKTIRIGFVGWVGVVGLAVGCVMLTSQSAMAQTQNSVSFGHHTDQQPSQTADAVPVFTPELKADMLEVHGQYESAIDAYRKIRPETAEISNKIGIAYQRMGMDQEAIGWYDQAVRMDHKYAAAYNNVGTVYFHEKDNKLAKKFYKKSIHLDADSAPFWSNLGAVYLADRKYSDGVEAYEKAFKLDPNIFDEIALNGIHHYESPEELAKMYLTFAEIYAHAGMKAQAVLYIQKAMDEGFHNREMLQQDQQLATLHGYPAFELMVADRHRL